MAIAHVCLGCGWDLARVRPQREPHYGLDLVRCPRCQRAVIRRRHPVWTRWRQFRRLDFAITVLGVILLITALLTFLNVMAAIMCIAIVSEARTHTGRPTPEGLVVVIIVIFGILAPLTGTWLTAAFEHVPRWRVWCGWLVWIGLILLIVSMHGPLDDLFDPRGSLQGYGGSAWMWVVEGIDNIVLPGVAAMMVLLIAAMPGMLAGHGVLRLAAAVRRARWRWRRRRRRLDGAAA